MAQDAGFTTAVENLASSGRADPADISLVAHRLVMSPGSRETTIDLLRDLKDEVKVTIVQRFFAHPDEGTHRTSFDQEVVADLLRGWFDISIEGSTRPVGRFGTANGPRPAPVQTFSFGPTRFFLYMTDEKRRVLDCLAGLLGDDAVLTTDRTSPPSTLAELIPLWLKERQRATTEYYVREHPVVDFDSFFASYAAAVRSSLGITVREPSRELGFVVNGDGLRYHRDRLINQYEALARCDPFVLDATCVVQDLSVVDWDMQDGTFSGTVFVHPRGDRYIFMMQPGEATSLFFSEQVQLPGPMMMPYHCALPVQDSFAGTTAGEAMGKRFSCLVRGIADAVEVERLAGAAVPIDINEGRPVPGGYAFPNGMRIEERVAPDCESADADSTYDIDQGCLVTRLSSRSSAKLLDRLGAPAGHNVFRLTKHGDGFTGLRDVLPMISGHDIVVVNRSVNTPRPGTSHPLALRLIEPASPVLQLIQLPVGQALHVPAAVLDTLFVSPTAPIFHRSAPLDAFYPVAPRTARMTTIVDVVAFTR